jgi:hypothetical protein
LTHSCQGDEINELFLFSDIFCNIYEDDGILESLNGFLREG